MSNDSSNRDFSEQNMQSSAIDVLKTKKNACCGLGHFAGMALVAVSLASVAVAGYFVGKSRTLQAQSQPPFSMIDFPLIDATTAVSSEKFSMATGPMSEEAEGLFVLDHNSGLLQCTVIYPRAGQFMASFTTNVSEALATGGKGGTYMMVTGTADFPRASNRPAAPSVIYVLNTSTGGYACYGIPFNRQLVNANQPQTGALVLIATGMANPVIDRDALR